MTQGLKTHRMLFLAVLLNHILHCICFKILSTVSKYLVSNRGYSRLIRTIEKWKKSNKKFKTFCVIIILCNHLYGLLKLLFAVKGFILYQTNQMASTLQLIANSHTPAELKNCKLKKPFLLFGPLVQDLGRDDKF